MSAPAAQHVPVVGIDLRVAQRPRRPAARPLNTSEPLINHILVYEICWVALRIPPNPCTRSGSIDGNRLRGGCDQCVTTATRRWGVAVVRPELRNSPGLESDASHEGLARVGIYSNALTSRRRNSRNREALTRGFVRNSTTSINVWTRKSTSNQRSYSRTAKPK